MFYTFTDPFSLKHLQLLGGKELDEIVAASKAGAAPHPPFGIDLFCSSFLALDQYISQIVILLSIRTYKPKDQKQYFLYGGNRVG